MQPLTGFRILDLTKLLPGPWCTMLLGDLGAEVVKVENPDGGDNARASAPYYETASGRESIYFANLNRNKRSITLNLKTADGKVAFLALAKDADAVVESFRPGTMERLGLGYEVLREVNPRLIYAAISGYGQTGAGRDLAGHDLNIAGLTGLLQLSSAHTPVLPGILVGDYAGATMAIAGILSAYIDRLRHGRGAFIDVSMLDAAVAWTSVQMTWAFAGRMDSRTTGAIEGWGGNPRYNIYRARDGKYLTVSLLERKYWESFCRHFDRVDLIDANETEADRLTGHRERGPIYRKFLEDLFARKDRDEWITELAELHLPICPLFTLDEAFTAPFGRERGHFPMIPFDRLGVDIPQHGFPFRMTMSDGADAFAWRMAPPALGQDNEMLQPHESDNG